MSTAGHTPALRVPLRVRHSEGGGALGRFTTTHDVGAFTEAALFQSGVVTPTTVRFSSTIGYLGSPDAWRDVRGFAVKFSTPQGDYDLVGNNSPVFFLRDDRKFASLVVSQKLHGPGALDELFDYDRLWEFWTAHPETAHQVTWLLGDRGIPRTWRHQNGYGTHTYQWTGPTGDRFWVKYHWHSEQGVEWLSHDEAADVAGTEVDHYSGGLASAIERGEHPAWRLSVQLMPHDDAVGYRFNPFDLTKVWPKGDYPLLPVGRLVLDRNPADAVAEIEQAAFSPSSFVPGIAASPDPMLRARILSYPTFHRHRVVVRPAGAAGAADAGTADAARTVDAADAARFSGDDDPALLAAAGTLHVDDDDFGQAGTLVRDVLSHAARARLIDTIVAHLAPVTRADIRARALDYWARVDPALGASVAAGLGD